MKHLIVIAVICLFEPVSARASIVILPRDKMIEQADIIALVDILQLKSTNLGQSCADLIADAQVVTTYKSNLDVKSNQSRLISFRIPRWFPCAAFDVSTGRHIIFIKKKDETLDDMLNRTFVSFNWYMSCVYVGSDKTKWYDEKGAVSEQVDTDKVLSEMEEIKKEHQERSKDRKDKTAD